MKPRHVDALVYPLFRLLPLISLAALAALISCASGDPAPTSPPPSSVSNAPSSSATGADASDVDIAPSGDTSAGASLVLANGCGGCHQSQNAADGILSGRKVAIPGTGAFPANLTPDESTGLGAWTDAQITDAIRTGVGNDGSSLCDVMPRFPLSDDDAAAIVLYLRSLPPIIHDIPDSVCDEEDPDAGANLDASLDAPFDAASCTAWASPWELALCHACVTPPCQRNGCFNGWWCDEETSACHPSPPAACIDP